MLICADYHTLQKTVSQVSLSNNLTVIPIKDFNNSKSRLKDCLSDVERVNLVKNMVINVIRALDGKCIAVSYSQEVCEFIDGCGIHCLKLDIKGLNSTTNYLYQYLNITIFNRLTIIHADIPLATVDNSPHEYIKALASDEFLIYPDIEKLGTPVISVPSNTQFKFMYGRLSFKKHVFQIESLNAQIKIVEDPAWSFDVDKESDLIKYYELKKSTLP